ncbi:MAG: FAD-binding protein [Candidatus Poseidoniales archaeon]
MQAWDVVVVGGSIASLRAAIAASDEGATVTVLTPSSSSAFVDDTTSCGLATSSGETNPSEHAADTRRVGADLCETDVVASSTNSAVAHLAELERWGLNLRRDRNGSPHLGQLPGQSNPRTASTGDSTLREVRTILEEQCIKRNIPRRGDIEILDIVHKDHDNTKGGPRFSSSDDGFDVCGLIALDIQSGEIFAIQSKAVVLAGSGFQSAWNGDGIGMGTSAHLFLKLGHYLSDLEFTSYHPLTVADTNLQIPLDVLGSGGIVNGSDGQPISMDDGPDALAREILKSGGGSLDLTAISRTDAPWFANVADALLSRCGIDYSQQLIPLKPIVSTTIGGLPTNPSGNVCSFEWDIIPGLFAAGDAACTGLHGASMNSGDHLLGALTSGSVAGATAANHASGSKFVGSSAISGMLTEAHHLHDSILAEAGSDGTSTGNIQSQLAATMQAHMGHERSAGGLEKAQSILQELSETKMAISDTSPVMNTELVAMLRTKGLVYVARSAVGSAAERKESRGSHVRTDFPETDDEQSHHSFHSFAYPGTLPLRN